MNISAVKLMIVYHNCSLCQDNLCDFSSDYCAFSFILTFFRIFPRHLWMIANQRSVPHMLYKQQNGLGRRPLGLTDAQMLRSSQFHLLQAIRKEWRYSSIVTIWGWYTYCVFRLSRPMRIAFSAFCLQQILTDFSFWLIIFYIYDIKTCIFTTI